MDRLNQSSNTPSTQQSNTAENTAKTPDDSASPRIGEAKSVDKKISSDLTNTDRQQADKPLSERMAQATSVSAARSDEEVAKFRTVFETQWHKLINNSSDAKDLKFDQVVDRVTECYKYRSSTLDLSDCGLHHLRFACWNEQMPSLSPLEEHVTELNLSNNGSSFFAPDGLLYNFGAFFQLEKLTLDKCGLTDVPEKEISDCGEDWPKLTYLSLKNNKLGGFPLGIESLQSLKELHLEGNTIFYFPQDDSEREMLAKTGRSIREQGQTLEIYLNGNVTDADQADTLLKELKEHADQLFNIKYVGVHDLREESDDDEY